MSALGRGKVRCQRVIGVPVGVAAALLTIAALALLPAGPATGQTTPASTTPTTPVNPEPPTAATGTAETIAGTSATLTATISARGADTTYRFQYGTSTTYGLTTASATVPADAAAVTVRVPISGLTTGTTYHFRILATNAAGSVQGSDRTFVTVPEPRAPALSTQSASRITTTGAQLSARITPQGQDTTLTFQWGPTTAYGATTPPVSAGSSRGTVTRSAALSGLAPGTTYHYRAVATNASGTTFGADRTFTTSRGLTSIDAVLSNPTVPWNRAITVSGVVRGLAPVGVRLELLRQERPFTGPYRRYATTTSTAGGAFSFPLSKVFASARVRVRVIGSTLQGPELSVGSELLITLRTSARKARTVRLSGRLYPATTSARAVLQRQTPSGRWTTVRTLRLTALPNQRVSFRTVVRRLSRTSSYRVVVDPRDDGAHVATTSLPVRVAARR